MCKEDKPFSLGGCMEVYGLIPYTSFLKFNDQVVFQNYLFGI